MDVIYSDDCLLHDPPYEVTRGVVKPYVESPARLESIKAFIDAHPEFRVASPRDYTLTPVLAVHETDYIQYLATIYKDWVASGLPPEAVTGETFVHPNIVGKIGKDIYRKNARLSPSARVGLYTFDMSVAYTKDTWRAAYTSVQIALTAAHELTKAIEDKKEDDKVSSIYALCRPPGHHSTCNVAAGYCFINNVAVVTRFLQTYNLQEMEALQKPLEFTDAIGTGNLYAVPAKDPKKKILIVDIDYHHGNGTQDIFWEDPSVFYISLHGCPDYPFYTGSTEEIGSGPGEGYNINVPLNPATTTDTIYLDNLTRVLEDNAVVSFDADVVICSMGLDTWHEDPIAGMKGLKDIETYFKIGKLFKTASSCRGKPVLFVQEGGYTVEKLGQLAGRVLQGFVDA